MCFPKVALHLQAMGRLGTQFDVPPTATERVYQRNRIDPACAFCSVHGSLLPVRSRKATLVCHTSTWKHILAGQGIIQLPPKRIRPLRIQARGCSSRTFLVLAHNVTPRKRPGVVRVEIRIANPYPELHVRVCLMKSHGVLCNRLTVLPCWSIYNEVVQRLSSQTLQAVEAHCCAAVRTEDGLLQDEVRAIAGLWFRRQTTARIVSIDAGVGVGLALPPPTAAPEGTVGTMSVSMAGSRAPTLRYRIAV